jgi:hypothetical protein
MAKANADDQLAQPANPPIRLRLPGFVKDEDIGLGDFIGRIAYAIHIDPCSSCKNRASYLNRRVVFHK